MKAAILTDFNTPLQVFEVAPTALGPRDAIVRVDASGVCHSDLTVATGGGRGYLPVIVGHEGAGTILEVGPAVTRVKPGDRVICSFVPACGNCWFCLHDQSYLCDSGDRMREQARATFADGRNVHAHAGLGTFSEQMTVDESMLVKVNTDLPSEQLALIGCAVTTGVCAVLNTARVEPGSTVAVVGCGGVGQSVIQGARIAGASRIFAIDPVELKRKTALQLGATDAIDPFQGDAVAHVREATAGLGVDYAFEVLGLPQTILQAYELARRGGTAVVIGMARNEDSVTFPASNLFRQAKRILGCYYGSASVRRDFPRLLGLIEAGRLDVGSLVSRRIKLEEVNDAFRAMQAGEVIRSVIAH